MSKSPNPGRPEAADCSVHARVHCARESFIAKFEALSLDLAEGETVDLHELSYMGKQAAFALRDEGRARIAPDGDSRLKVTMARRATLVGALALLFAPLFRSKPSTPTPLEPV